MANFAAILIACSWMWSLVQGVTDVVTYNDFEVYHFIGGIAAERSDNIYRVLTPHQQRGPFLYPPSAAVLFVPLSWLSHHAAGVLFAVAKMFCLAALWWGSVRCAGVQRIATPLFVLCVLAIAIIMHRAVWSDIGNGQINIILALAAAGGMWLMMLSRRWWWLGSITLAWAIAIKMTPALLLAALLLNRKWKQLAATTLITIALLLVLPMVWFGSENLGRMNEQYREIAGRFTFDWAAPHEQSTPTELLQFVRLQTKAATLTSPDVPEVLPVPISGNAGRWLFDPQYRAPAMWFWLLVGLAAGAMFLLWRWRCMTPARLEQSTSASVRPQRDWTWDVAMLCALIVLLSPRAQKAHLVFLIVPVGWLAAHVLSAGPQRLHIRILCLLAVGALLLIGESLRIPVPGWELPLRCLPLLGTAALIAAIALVGKRDSASPAVSSTHAT